MEKRTLCKRCADNYRTAGYILKGIEFQFIREPCDICSNPGIEYVVLKKSGGDGVECG